MANDGAFPREKTSLFGTQVMLELDRALAATLLELVREGMSAGVTPEGAPLTPNGPWKARTPHAGEPPLTFEGHLKRAWTPFSNATKFGVVNKTVYARVQQQGGTVGRGVVLPARPMVPEGPLPPAWQARLESTARRVLDGKKLASGVPLSFSSSVRWFL